MRFATRRVAAITAIAGGLLLGSAAPSLMAQDMIWARLGSTAREEFGASVATRGDVNGDGLSDVVAGAPAYDGSPGCR